MSNDDISSEQFIVIGENIHCSRIVRPDGRYVKSGPDGSRQIEYTVASTFRHLPVPRHFQESPDWAAGKLRHCAVAAWQGLHGNPEEQAAARDYISAMASKQADAGAAYIDVNVDEFSPDVEQRCQAMHWMAEVAQSAGLPLSIDSSHPAVLETGLRACARDRRPLLNSVSLERVETIDLAKKYNTGVIASAAGVDGIPASAGERLQNLEQTAQKLSDAGIELADIYMDPLVFPVATDGANPGITLETIRFIRQQFGTRTHVTGGFSNVSFGMPARSLINLVFTRMALEAGADSGIIDPLQINKSTLTELDVSTEKYQLAKNLLSGADDFGAEFIAAYRDGILA